MPHNKEKQIHGGGPWKFDNPELSPNEPWVLDFRNMEYEGTKGYFKKWYPFDVAQITNLSGEILEVKYNGIYNDIVVPNAAETYEKQGVTNIRVVNGGDTTIAAGDVKVSVKVEPYGADEAAREKVTEPWLKRAANELIPGGIPGSK